jgi:hypothetical protein
VFEPNLKASDTLVTSFKTADVRHREANISVHALCRYFTGEAGQYQPLLPAPYDPATGECLK